MAGEVSRASDSGQEGCGCEKWLAQACSKTGSGRSANRVRREERRFRAALERVLHYVRLWVTVAQTQSARRRRRRALCDDVLVGLTRVGGKQFWRTRERMRKFAGTAPDKTRLVRFGNGKRSSKVNQDGQPRLLGFTPFAASRGQGGSACTAHDAQTDAGEADGHQVAAQLRRHQPFQSRGGGWAAWCADSSRTTQCRPIPTGWGPFD